MQRIRIKLLKYRLKLVFVPGKDMHVADTLSRAYLDERTEYESLNQIVHSVSVSESRRLELVEATKTDSTLIELRRIIQNGWPADKTKVNPNMKIFLKNRNQLYTENDLMFFNHRMIIPQDLRKKFVDKAALFGINRTISRAKEIMYWPGMTEQIIETISKCGVCSKLQRSNTREPMMAHEVPSSPFEKSDAIFLILEEKITWSLKIIFPNGWKLSKPKPRQRRRWSLFGVQYSQHSKYRLRLSLTNSRSVRTFANNMHQSAKLTWSPAAHIIRNPTEWRIKLYKLPRIYYENRRNRMDIIKQR